MINAHFYLNDSSMSYLFAYSKAGLVLDISTNCVARTLQISLSEIEDCCIYIIGGRSTTTKRMQLCFAKGIPLRRLEVSHSLIGKVTTSMEK
ncbi:hypothetical protein AVEN_250636-1 [Araneus ventricosus]|uniref:Uncharacterized protein n=1 Tax=Araneus ventricosus TaxID=182803 RepID=A0A4Y2JFC2_ARAVE|nr:hypothetical protein AVEN_250636-1 [Araneus ventricosus]